MTSELINGTGSIAGRFYAFRRNPTVMVDRLSWAPSLLQLINGSSHSGLCKFLSKFRNGSQPPAWNPLWIPFLHTSNGTSYTVVFNNWWFAFSRIRISHYNRLQLTTPELIVHEYKIRFSFFVNLSISLCIPSVRGCSLPRLAMKPAQVPAHTSDYSESPLVRSSYESPWQKIRLQVGSVAQL